MACRTLVFLLVTNLAACGTDHAGSASAGSTGETEAVDSPRAGPTRATGPDASDPEAGRELRVVFLGTSVTAGLGLMRPEERYTEILEQMADSAGIDIRAVNAGVSGSTSAGGLSRLDWVLEQPPDVLVVELGANDGLRGQDPAALESNLRAIVQRTRIAHPRAHVVLAAMEAPPNLGEDYTRRFRQVYVDVARDLDVTLIPFLLEGVAGEREMNLEDGMHPNATGHRLIARIVWPVLEPVLREAARTGRDAAREGSEGS